MKKKLIFAIVAAATLSVQTNVYASENDLLDEILAKEEARTQEWLDMVSEIEEHGIPEEDNNELMKRQVTCYIERGKKTATGSSKMDGIIAAAPEYLGCVAQVYEVAEDGGVGEFIGYFPIEDTGYGAPTGKGKSIYKGRKSAGTIEAGITYDFRKPNMSAAKEFMKANYTGEGSTGSQVWISIVDGEG